MTNTPQGVATKMNDLIQKLFDSIPQETVKKIIAEKKGSAPQTKDIRVVTYLPLEWYAILEYFGHLEEGDTPYLRALVREDIREILYKMASTQLESKNSKKEVPPTHGLPTQTRKKGNISYY